MSEGKARISPYVACLRPTMISKIDLAAAHIRQCLAQTTKRPLFVGLQGPQGSGKSYLCARLPEALAPIRAAVLSIDDLYLPHAELVRVAREHPSNKLFAGRGQPGTHDVELGVRTFEALSKADGEASLPVFDKSLHGGEGDRVKSIEVQLPLDVVVVEGWCMGFYPLSNEALDAANAPTEVREINEFLKEYASEWYPFFSAFIQVRITGIQPLLSFSYCHTTFRLHLTLLVNTTWCTSGAWSKNIT